MHDKLQGSFSNSEIFKDILGALGKFRRMPNVRTLEKLCVCTDVHMLWFVGRGHKTSLSIDSYLVSCLSHFLYCLFTVSSRTESSGTSLGFYCLLTGGLNLQTLALHAQILCDLGSALRWTWTLVFPFASQELYLQAHFPSSHSLLWSSNVCLTMYTVNGRHKD